jgi:hypothetical protein
MLTCVARVCPDLSRPCGWKSISFEGVACLGLFGRNAWWEWCTGSRRRRLLSAVPNERPGLLGEGMTVTMAFSQFHLSELSPGDKIQLKPYDSLSQERLARDGEEKFLLIGPSAEVRLIGRVDGFDRSQDTIREGGRRAGKIPHLIRRHLPNLGQARDAA